MNELKFQTSITILAWFRFVLIYIACIAAICFSIYMFHENNIFFSLLILTGIAVLFLSGPKTVKIFDDYFVISTRRLIHIPALDYKYYYKDIIEVAADIPNEIAEMILIRKDPISFKYRFSIVRKSNSPISYWLATERKELVSCATLINDYCKEFNNI